MNIPPSTPYDLQMYLKTIEQRIADLEGPVGAVAPDVATRSELDDQKAQLVKLIDRPRPLRFTDEFRGSGPTHMFGHVPDTKDDAAWDERVLTEAGWAFPFRGMIRPITNLGVLGTKQYAGDILQVLASLAVTGNVSASKAYLKDLEVTGVPNVRAVGAKVWHSSNLTGAQGTPLAVTYDTVVLNSDKFFNIASPSRFTVPSGMDGYYLIGALAGLTTSGASTYHTVYIQMDGTTNIAVTRDYGATSESRMSVSVMRYLNAGQYIKCIVHADGTGTLTALPAEALAMWMFRIGV